MANTLTNVTQEILQDEVLPSLKLDRNPINAFSMNVDMKGIKAKGDTVKVSIATARTAGDFAGTFASGDSTVESENVTLGTPQFAGWYVDPMLEGMPTIERWLAQGRECAAGVVKKITQDVLGLFLAANIGDVADTDKKVIAVANYDTDDQADLWTLLATKGLAGSRSAIHTIAYAGNLMKDAALKDASAYGNSTLIQTGELPPVLGARQFYTDLFPSTITAENTRVIYTGKETAAIGFAEPASLGEGLENASGVRIIPMIDPETGIPMFWRQWYEANTGYFRGAVYAMYGVKFLRNSAVRVVDA